MCWYVCTIYHHRLYHALAFDLSTCFFVIGTIGDALDQLQSPPQPSCGLVVQGIKVCIHSLMWKMTLHTICTLTTTLHDVRCTLTGGSLRYSRGAIWKDVDARSLPARRSSATPITLPQGSTNIDIDSNLKLISTMLPNRFSRQSDWVKLLRRDTTVLLVAAVYAIGEGGAR